MLNSINFNLKLSCGFQFNLLECMYHNFHHDSCYGEAQNCKIIKNIKQKQKVIEACIQCQSKWTNVRYMFDTQIWAAVACNVQTLCVDGFDPF